LMRGDGKTRLAEWEKVALAGLFLLSLSPRTLTELSHLPVGSLIALALATIVAARALCSTALDSTTRASLLRRRRHLSTTPARNA
jgi:hypothetical protein